MPTEDTCQPEVIAALQKDGWTITGEQIQIKAPDLYVFIDVEAMKEDRQAFIEVKCFPGGKTTIQFYSAMGQYLVYRKVLKTKKPNHTLYLAVPAQVYETLGETYRDTASENHVKMVIVDIEMEVITKWIE